MDERARNRQGSQSVPDLVSFRKSHETQLDNTRRALYYNTCDIDIICTIWHKRRWFNMVAE